MRFTRITRTVATLALACWWLAALPARALVVDDTAVAAVAAAADGDYDRGLAADPVTRSLTMWLQLRAGDMDFPTAHAFLDAHPDWPDQNGLRASAERRITKQVDPQIVLDFFADGAPQTGEGAVRLAEAMIRLGRNDDARDVLRDAWLTLGMTRAGHDAMIDAFADILAPFHIDRVDMLLWRWRTQGAQRMLPLLDPDRRAWVNARIAYIRKTGDIADRVAAVRADLSDEPGMAYDHFNWLADTGRRAEALDLLRNRSRSADALGQPFRWSGWRRSLARWEMRNGDAELAYEIASRHFLTEGAAFADLEWLSGYLQLRKLGDPAAALPHFEAGLAAVSSPISLGRMYYWIARTHEALGHVNAAAAAYRLSARHQTSFYGLLSADALGLPLDPALTGAGDATDWENAAMLDDPVVRAGLALLQAQEPGLALPFFSALAQRLPADDLARLGALLNRMDRTYFTVLIGKAAVTRDVLVPSNYFPLHPLAEMDLPAPAALSLSIARRESEFNIGVGSPVGALGLMQLMPATAAEVAGELGLDYSRNRLTTDWRFNAQLGTQYLAGLIARFGPSPVYVAAGYNAGPSRPAIWIDERGDPRLGEVDIVDWIEHIPFRETRNYVQRVAESIPVYEARLTGRTGPVDFRRLLIGEKPLVRPRARPESVPQPVVVPRVIAPLTRRPRTRPADLGQDRARPAIGKEAAITRPVARPEG